MFERLLGGPNLSCSAQYTCFQFIFFSQSLDQAHSCEIVPSLGAMPMRYASYTDLQ